MGFMNALIGSAARFREGLLPPRFSKGRIKWALDLDLVNSRNTQLVQIDADGVNIPDKPPDRTSSRISAKLFTDKAEYALGTGGGNAANTAFINLSLEAEQRFPAILSGISEALKAVPDIIRTRPKPADQVAVRLGGQRLTDRPEIAALYAEMMEQRAGAEPATCAICGMHKPASRLFPGDITLFSERGVKLMSVDSESEDKISRDPRGVPEKIASAFSSRGRLQLRNSPICMACGSAALQVCRYLTSGHLLDPVGLNYAVLARDQSPRRNQPLRNQLAVFWTKLQFVDSNGDSNSDDGDRPLTGPEAAARLAFRNQDVPDEGPPPEDAQMRAVLSTPWRGGHEPAPQANAFYLAVLSPNKTRLVIRDWMELGADEARRHISHYVTASRIVHPDGRASWFPPLPALLDALHPPKTEGGDGRRDNNPHLLRALLRCAFRGESPPKALLLQAVQRIAIKDSEKEHAKQRALRRMNIAAALKLCLTHGQGREEQEAMERLDENRHNKAYLCGRLLAVLDEVQRQYHRPSKVNTTLADRFYGAASTAPASVFANLMNIATKAHLPKLRRDGRDFIGTKVEEVCSALDDAGGFPPPLSPPQQAEFGLGYYHQRAKFAAEWRALKLKKDRTNAGLPLTEGATNV